MHASYLIMAEGIKQRPSFLLKVIMDQNQISWYQEGLPPLVGSEAAILTNEARPIFEVKRLMGRKFDSITEEESRRFTFGEVENVDGMAHLRVPENGTVISPEEVKACVRIN